MKVEIGILAVQLSSVQGVAGALLEGCAATAGWRELAFSKEESEYQVMSLELQCVAK